MKSTVKNNEKLKKSCAEAVTTFEKLGLTQFEDTLGRLKWCIGSYEFDKNPSGLNELGEIALNELKEFIKNYNNENHAFAYDQIVSYGELFSTTIISHYFHHNGKNNNWLDARKLIVTSDQFQEARVHWGESQKNIHKSISNRGGIYITQGFIGGVTS